MTTTSSVSYYLKDHLGSMREVLTSRDGGEAELLPVLQGSGGTYLLHSHIAWPDLPD